MEMVMNRRKFLTCLRNTTTLSTTCGLGYVISASNKAKDISEKSLHELSNKFSQLEDRFDNMNKSHKKTMKAVLILAGLSTGIDMTIILG